MLEEYAVISIYNPLNFHVFYTCTAMKTRVFLLPLFFVEIFAININFSICNGNYYMGCLESEREAQAS